MISKDFILAGRAVFTIELNPNFAEKENLPSHYTYKVKHVKANGNFKEAYFVSILAGPKEYA